MGKFVDYTLGAVVTLFVIGFVALIMVLHAIY